MFLVDASAPIYEWCVKKAGTYIYQITADEDRNQSLDIVCPVKGKYRI